MIEGYSALAVTISRQSESTCQAVLPIIGTQAWPVNDGSAILKIYSRSCILQKRLWRLEKVEAYTLVISAEGVMTTRSVKNISTLGLPHNIIRNGQKAVVLHTYVVPMPAPSNYILGNAYAKTLAEAGHDVTMIPFMNMVGNMVTRDTLAHPNFQKLIESKEQFDVVVLEQFNDDALKVLAYHFQAPLIVFSTIGCNSIINPSVGNPAPPSYIPESFLKYSSHMTIWERLVNLLFAVAMEVNRQLIFFPTQNKIMKKHFPNVPDLSLLNYNASLILLGARMIDIGGYHVSPPKKLPKVLKEFMDNAKEGVVYFSMGSNIKPCQMSDKIRDAILKCLGKIKQKVIKSYQIKVGSFPAHPSTKLFITHGGLLSTIETVSHGVPVLTLPVFGDQKMNAARAVENGVGLSVVFSQITEETLGGALRSLLHDPKYRETAVRMHDRPVKPKDLAVYWTEFVIRHKGAPI
ncbi:hypothetical protein NQ318_011386 [Aromia moschata]|uniref:Uncharacterized protein n=1 Tax=Aromia moschata TaxID=1265417 RepID=A0AAV8YVA6_9CUCU|nr:hypothetical protein NQ318_011386 [Aromia moschata]